MRQQVFDPAAELRRQALEHVAQVGPRVVSIHACRLHQAQHDGGPLASEFASNKHPRFASHCPWLDLTFEVVVVNRHGAVVEMAR